MKLIDKLTNNFIGHDKYKTDSEAVIISCYFNPQNNPYRKKAFDIFYDTIKHLNHKIVECVIGDSEPQLPENEHISRIHADSLLWHKESILNYIIANLDPKYKYVFWVDADVLFTNKNWLVESVEVLKTHNIMQPFEYCIHLEQDESEPSFNPRDYDLACLEADKSKRHPKMWRSFCANQVTNAFINENYDVHGHVGFAWGARRDVLDVVPLYAHALVGGGDHIMAHAAAGHIPHSCITKSFTDDIESITEWSKNFFSVIQGKIGYVSGDLYHIWHGSLASREYFKRIKDFTPIAKNITERDEHGLYVTNDDSYVREYFNKREVKETDDQGSFNNSVLNTIATISLANQMFSDNQNFS